MSATSDPPTRPPRRFVGQRQLVADPAPGAAGAPGRSRPPEPGPARPESPPRDDEGARDVVPFAARYAAAAPAAAYLGRLQDLSAGPVALQHGLGSWWVRADLPLNLARELVLLFDGAGYLIAGDQLAPDRGWGPARPAPAAAGPMVAPGELTAASAVELVAAAGLRRRPAPLASRLVVLTTAPRAQRLIHRALDLRLETAYRPVRVAPLALAAAPGLDPDLGPDGAAIRNGALAGTLVQVSLRATAAREHLPAALLSALDADQATLACREAAGSLLMQHEQHSPLTDRQLAALVPAGVTWVLAAAPMGCWTLEALAPFEDGWRLITLGPAHALRPGGPGWADPAPAPLPEPQPLQVVRSRPAASAPVDAILLENSDLDAVRLLLEGHPLAETAALVPGRSCHLLIAPGGVADRIPVGEYLTCAGPGSIFVAHGWRTDPELPASAWRDLARDLGQRALVLQADRTLVFDLTRRRPVWELWAGEPPAVDVQIPAAASAALDRLDAEERAAEPAAGPPSAVPPAVPPPGEPASAPPERRDLRERLRRLAARTGRAPGPPATWQEQAATAELAHDLVAAAELHAQHGDHLRAGRLYERAAYEGDAGGGSGAGRPS